MRDNALVETEHWNQLFPENPDLTRPLEVKEWLEQFMK